MPIIDSALSSQNTRANALNQSSPSSAVVSSPSMNIESNEEDESSQEENVSGDSTSKELSVEQRVSLLKNATK